MTQLFIKPYKHMILNTLDGLVLQITIIVTITTFIDGFDKGILLSVIIVLVIIPLIAFVTMELIVYKENIKNLATYFKPKPVTTNVDDGNELPPICDIGLVIDDNMRKNATIVDM